MNNYNNETQYAMYWWEKMAEDNYEDTRMINKETALLNVRGNAKLNLEYQKVKLRQGEEEAKRGTYEEVAFDEEGKPYVVTRNLWIDTKPREFANLRYPRLFRMVRKECHEEQVFLIDCMVNEKTCKIYLDPKKIGSGSYLLGKLAAAGISIYAPEKKAKEYARLLLSWLLRYVKDLVIVDEPGYFETDGKISFISEGSMTWQKIKNLL